MKKDQSTNLSRKAEELFNAVSSKPNSQMTEDEVLKLVQEMEVLQVELELQNEELAKAKAVEEINGAKYRNLFDDAPSGYFTLDSDANITEVNHAGAKLLGKDRNKLNFSQFRFFVSVGSKETFNLFFEKVWFDEKKETCEISILDPRGAQVNVRIDGVVVDNGSHCLITVTDITDRINAENELRNEVERTKLLLDLFTKAPLLTDNELYGEILDIVVKVTVSKIAFLHKISSDQQEVILTTRKSETKKKGLEEVDENHYPINDAGNLADCIRLKLPIVRNNIRTPDNSIELSTGHTHVDRTLAIPIVQDDKVYIILGVANKQNNYLNSDISHIQFVADEFYKILEKRKVETALKESESKALKSNLHLKSILESPHGIIIFSLDRNYCYTAFTVSHREVMNVIWGRTIEIGMNILEIISLAEDRAKARFNFDRVFTGEFFILDEEYGEAGMFRTFWENRYSPIYNDLSEITGLTVFVTEITERRRAEEELRRSEEKYRNIFENVYDVYYEALLDGTIIEISPSIETISKGQYKRNELIGKSIVDFYSNPEERNNFYYELSKFGKVTDFELSLLNRDGSVMPISISSGLRHDATGRPVIIGSMRDITERKKSEKLIAQNNKDLQFLNSFALSLSRLSSSDALDGFLLQQLKGYTEATIVAYSEYNRYDQALVTRIVDAERVLLDLVVEVTGSDLINLEIPVSEDIYNKLVSCNINKHDTFTEASFGTIPIDIDSVFRERSRIKNIYGIALTIGAELYGTLLLCFADDVPTSSEELMQSFANLSAVALRRKRAEDDLKISYDQLEQKVVERTLELNQVNAFNKAIVNNAGVTVISTTNTGEVVTFNPAAEQMLGYRQEEVIGKFSILQFFDKIEIFNKAKEYGTLNNDGTFDLETYIDYVIEKRPDTFEWKMVRRDGTAVPVLLSLDWLKGSDGWNTGYVGVATDITLRKQTEDALMISEKNLSQITDSVPIFIALLNKDLEYIFTNRAYEKFLNLTKLEILGKNVKEIVGDIVYERAYSFLLRALDGETNTIEIMLSRSDGQERIVLATYLPYYQGDAICGVLATIIDITERIKSKELLHKKEIENLAILKAVPDLFFKIDKYGRFLSYQSGENIPLFVTPGKFLGKKIEDVMPPNLSLLALSAMNQALQSKELVSFEYELTFNNDVRFFEDRVLTIDEDEILMIIRDITDRKITEKALRWNESLLKKVTESSPLGFLVVDNRTDEILYFNRNFCEIWGILHLEERMRNKELTNNDIIPDCLPVLKDVPAFAESCKPLQDVDNRITIEDEIPFLDGRIIRRFSAQIRDDEDQYNGRLYIFEDISFRKLSEEIVVMQRDLATGLSATSDLNEALKLTLRSILQIKNVDGGGIYLMNTETGELELKAHQGLSDQFIQTVCHYGSDSTQLKLIRKGIPIYGFSNQIITSSAREAELDQILSVAIIPIQHEGVVIGSINLSSKSSYEFYTNTHLSLEAIALQLGGTISRIFTEKALLSSQLNFKILFDTIDDFMFILDTNGNIMIVNSVVEMRLGYTIEELTGMNVLKVHPPERRDEAGFIVGEMIAGRTLFCPVPLFTKHGNYIPVETRVVLGKWDNKDVLFGISRDITDRQKAQHELELRESYLSAVINNHPGMFWLKDLQGRFLIVNSRNDQYLKTFLGANKLSVIGLTDFDIFSKDESERYRNQDKEVVKSLKPGVFEVYEVRDNQPIWHETFKFPVLGRSGEVIGISGYAIEITQRKQAEVALKMQSAAFESFALAIIITDIKGNIQWANSAYARLTGYELTEIVGKNNGKLVNSGKQNPDFYKNLWETIMSGKVWSGELINKRKDDTIYPEEQTITPILQTNGDISGFIAIKIDITKRKQLEESLMAAILKEKELNDLKSRFVSMASHEFRTPLASILITDESLISYWNRMSEDQIISKLQNVKDQVLHLTNIVNDVMQVSKIQEGQVTFSPQDVDFVALCHATIQNFNLDIDIKNKIEFETNFEILNMHLDLRLIRQVLNNLISNALKYSVNSPVVKVRLYQQDESIILTVQDNGIGIPEADQKYLFQPFYRATNVKQIQGTGLGLNIVKDAVRLHDGNINFVSLQKKGTTFVVQLPLKLKT